MMKMLRACMLIVLTSSVGISLACFSEARPEEQKTAEKDGFRLRISKLRPRWDFMSRDYLIEQASGDGSWRIAYRWNQDDPWPLSYIDLNVFSAKVGYFFRMSEYGVTVDSGNSWKRFNVYEALKKDDPKSLESRFDHGVPRVTIDANGKGDIYIQSFYDSNGPTHVVYQTADFGQTWSFIGSD